MTPPTPAPAAITAPSPALPALVDSRRWRRVPGLRRLAAFRAHVRSQLARACALETAPPERFGFRFETAVRLFVVTGFFHRWYFRVECHGLERLPPGPVLLVANHGSHVLAWDGAMIVTACLLEGDPPRLVHGMGHHRLMELPVLGRAAQRIGAVDGRRESCADLLRSGAAVLAFPEGTKALARGFRHRYRLSPFGHGFAQVALATGTPIVPVAVVGAEEEAPLLANPPWLARLLHTPVAPLAPTLFVPLPVKYRLHFGHPLRLRGSATPEAAAHQAAMVQDVVQGLVEHGLRQRSRIFF